MDAVSAQIESNQPPLPGTLAFFLEALRRRREELRERFHVKSLWIFGSRARDDYRPDSDLDILVEFDQPIGLEFVSLHDLLEEWLGIEVDLVSKNAVIGSPRLWAYIEKDLIDV
ncbi:MAG: nucleotidyltransferase family protein [Blastocatellia bacterium]